MSKKNEQLGMSFGTACSRLRKAILFKLVVDTQQNTCFKCKNEITNINQFSIEHKIPWLDNNPRLFWDLNNIAFSHRSCNSSGARNFNKLKAHCKRGHAFGLLNSYIRKGNKQRVCRVCRRYREALAREVLRKHT